MMRLLLAVGAATMLGVGVYLGTRNGFGVNETLISLAGVAWGAVVAWPKVWRVLDS